MLSHRRGLTRRDTLKTLSGVAVAGVAPAVAPGLMRVEDADKRTILVRAPRSRRTATSG